MHIKHAFELAWSGNSLLLMADSYESKQNWKGTFAGVLSSLATDRGREHAEQNLNISNSSSYAVVFGIPLRDLMTGRDNGKDIPYILDYTVQWLRDTNGKKICCCTHYELLTTTHTQKQPNR